MSSRHRHPARSFARAAVVLTIVVSLVAGAFSVPAGACWAPPVDGTVIDPFRPPACPWCAGNRGLEYRVRSRSTVRAVAPGTVSFSGVVAGTRYVVVRLADGRRVTYGRLASSELHRGDRVRVGDTVGRTGTRFFLGVRIGDRYVDPAPSVGRWVGRPRLVPSDGTAARPAPPPRLRCGR